MYRPDIDRAELVRRYCAGTTIDALTKRYKASRDGLKRLLKKQGVVLRLSTASQALLDAAFKRRKNYPYKAMAQAYQKGATVVQVATRFRTNNHVIYRALEHCNVPRRTPSEARKLMLARLSDKDRVKLCARPGKGQPLRKRKRIKQ